MKAIIIKSKNARIAKLGNGTIYTQNEGETVKEFKDRVKELFALESEEKLTFANVKYQDLMTETLELQLADAEGVEADAILEELLTRDDYEIPEELVEGSEEITEEEIIESVEENQENITEQEIVEECSKETDCTPLEEAKATLKVAQDALTEIKSTLKEKIETAKAEIADKLNKAKATLELAQVDTEMAIDEAEKAYKEARRVVAINNLGANEVEKTDEEKAADVARVSECKEALDTIKKDSKDTVEAAKTELKEVKSTQKSDVKEIQEACKKELEDAKQAVQDAKVAYDTILKASKTEAEQIITEAQTEYDEATKQVEELKEALKAAKEAQKAAKDKLTGARGTLKTSGTTRTTVPKISLEEALAQQEEAKQHIGKHVMFVPAKADAPIEGKIKTTTIDKRVNLAYYKVIGCEDNKLYHVRISRLNVEECQVEVTEA